ncbi:hypothetical protein [Streptomyces sp. NPDC002994]|uniref:hypothetical protein n=1 Tax=Streptomyces sp. NPDC002994 TaxID=3154441 RepID=UPI0033BB05FC
MGSEADGKVNYEGGTEKVEYKGGENPHVGDNWYSSEDEVFIWGGTDKDEHDRTVDEDHKPLLKGGTNEESDRRPNESDLKKSDFMKYSINGLKKMVQDADPGKIEEVSLHWLQVYEMLSGGDGDGAAKGVDAISSKDSIAGMLKTAVDNACEHWEGQAAAAFRLKASEIAASIQNGAAHAKLTADQLMLVKKDLADVKNQIADIEPPGKISSGIDVISDGFEQNDEQAMKDLKSGVRADVVAKANEGSLSAGMEEKLKAVALMEQLGMNYGTYARNLKSNAGSRNDKEGVDKPSGNVEVPPPISMPSPSGSGPGAAGAVPKPWSAGGTSKIGTAPQIPRAKGITGGSQLPPTTGTNIDSIKPGLTGPGLGPGPISGGGGGGGGGGATPPGLMVPGGSGGGPRPAGARGGISPVRGGSGRVGGPTVAGGTGRSAGGRPGMGGMGGGAGAGAAGRAGAGTGGRGPLAKARGGVVGAAKGITGKGAGGGAGLHGSRGGMAGGMAGGMGGRNGRRSGEENEGGERPDYLVEDEETWISEEDRNRNVPRNIE